MSRYVLIRILLGSAIAAIAATVWATGRIQSSADDYSTHAVAAGQATLIAMLDQETGLRGYINTGRQEFLEPYTRGRANLETATATAHRYSTDKADYRRLKAQTLTARRWQALAEAQVAHIDAGGAGRSVAAARRRKAIMDQFRLQNAAFTAAKEADRRHDHAFAQTVSLAIVLGLSLAFAALSWVTLERPARRDARRRRRLAEFGDALLVARSEREAFNVLRRHLEGWLEKARAVVLVRNSSANRLQAATTLEETPVLASRLEGAAPETCLAVRLAKPHVRKPGGQGLLVCELCGELPENSSCVPTIVGGEVVGSVLVQTPEALDRRNSEDLEASVSAAGPVIANLRNLAIAEIRAATDALTGLANHRSVQDSLNRMAAQAGRTKAPLAAVLFDLDHFKRVNDVYGHAKGDEVLASVGAAVAAIVRQSDFVGRYGGEEFVALLPDTDLDGALVLAEKLRSAIEMLEIPGLDGRTTASFGVALLPMHAVTGEQLLRAADRALYAAKNAGRNRVEIVRSGDLREEAAERG
jgi:diguanylate cyclase (GGDEF)-like protein